MPQSILVCEHLGRLNDVHASVELLSSNRRYLPHMVRLNRDCHNSRNPKSSAGCHRVIALGIMIIGVPDTRATVTF